MFGYFFILSFATDVLENLNFWVKFEKFVSWEVQISSKIKHAPNNPQSNHPHSDVRPWKSIIQLKHSSVIKIHHPTPLIYNTRCCSFLRLKRLGTNTAWNHLERREKSFNCCSMIYLRGAHPRPPNIHHMLLSSLCEIPLFSHAASALRSNEQNTVEKGKSRSERGRGGEGRAGRVGAARRKFYKIKF